MNAPQKSTLVGVGLAAATLYAGKVELASPPLHVVHASILAGLIVLSVVLILADDEKAFTAIGKLAAIAAPLLPWGKKDSGGGQ